MIKFNESILKDQRLLFFGAHPDDCEIYAGGLTVVTRELGVPVKYFIFTDGRYGAVSPEMSVAGERQLARIRGREQAACAKFLDVKYSWFGELDGGLHPYPKMRRSVVNEIRDFQATLVFTHRPVSHHPDHRAAGEILVDAMPYINKPLYAPEREPVAMPQMFYFWDAMFPPFKIGAVCELSKSIINKKQAAINLHASQRNGIYKPNAALIQANAWAKWYNYEVKSFPIHKSKQMPEYVEVFERSYYGAVPEYHNDLKLETSDVS